MRRMKKGSRPAAMGLVVLMAACGGARSGTEVVASAAAGSGVTEEQARLRPGDAIRLRIWREPELSGEFAIDQRGRVVLPRIGELAATEMTPDELEDRIRTSFERYLRNPSIEITMLRRINILGAVRSPGLYPLDPTMTLGDALAAAGGILPNGRQDRVEIIRDDVRVATHVTGDTRIFDLGLGPGDQLYVPERAWASRNAAVIATVASTVIGATVSLIIAFSR
jgi:polysaccharide biosynthesis/export protein